MPTFTPTPTPSPVPYITLINIVRHLTLPEGTALSYGEYFTETWVLQGSTLGRWPEGIKLVFVGGDQMDGPDEQEISPLPAPGDVITVSICLVAPTSNGEYEGAWQIQDVGGVPISDPLVANVLVYQPPPPVYSPPELQGLDVIGCNVTFRWDWPGTLAEDEWFAVRVGLGTPHSVVWLRDRQYTYTLTEAGEYVWEVGICRGSPETRICGLLALSVQQVFEFRGCGADAWPKPRPRP